jgi:hypothetical protein
MLSWGDILISFRLHERFQKILINPHFNIKQENKENYAVLRSDAL